MKRTLPFLLFIVLALTGLAGCNPSGTPASSSSAPAVGTPVFIVTPAAKTETALPEEPSASAVSAPSAAPTAVPTSASKTAAVPTAVRTAVPSSGKHVYHIEVSLKAQIVYVYDVTESGGKGALVKTMLCSTGRAGHETPKRTWIILDNSIDQKVVQNTAGFVSHYKFEWLKGCAGQYLTRMWKVDQDANGNEIYNRSSFLFHSAPYENTDKNTLKTEEWNKLGTPASDGCIRLCVADAKWIYDNVAAYSYVYTIEGTEDPALWKQLKRPDLAPGVTRDPTDTAA